MQTRKAAVSGLFYPQNQIELKDLVNHLILSAASFQYHPKAILVPHAGFIYSGPIAATAYGLLRKMSQTIKRIILLGPSHRVYVRGIALSSANYFETPLGKIEVDSKLRDKITGKQGITINDEAHQYEHSLEVQLPFLQVVLDQKIKILPAVTNDASNFEIENFLELVWGSEETIIIISSDLSHFLNYDAAKQKDQKTVESIINYDIDHISDDSACGSTALNGFLTAAKNKKLVPTLLDLRNSGDTGIEKNRVVGYASICFI
ncbi:MAG: AmmeMemoRadiSam system protein B [Spirochaetia bacterium]|nr:AmmeMemoRadiSam system protein B [Spirochaetia bacterium]